MSNAIQTNPNKKTIKDLVALQMPEIEKALPKHLTPDRLVRIFMTTISDPKFGKCTPESLVLALMRCSQIGLEPDGRMLALVPFGDTVTVIAMYQGLADLCWRSGLVDDIKANPIMENDFFDYQEGSNGYLHHKPLLKGDRGKVYAAYSLVTVKGKPTFYVMRLDEILAIRDMSAAYRSAKKYGKPTLWESSEIEMIRKSVFRRHCKLLPLSSEIRERMEDDDKVIDVESFGQRNQKPVLLSDVETVPSVDEETPSTPSDKKDDGDLGPVVETKSHLALRHLMKAGNITEAVFLSKMREGGLIDDAIDQLGLLSAKQCDAIAKDWVTLVEKMK